MERREMIVRVLIDHGDMTVDAVFADDGWLDYIEPPADSGLPARLERWTLGHETISQIDRRRDDQIEDEDNRAKE